MSRRLEESNQSTSSIPSNGYRGYTQQDSRHESNQSAYQLLAFKKSIKREVSQYSILKDEKYFEAFKRNLLVTAILDGNYKHENNNDSKELFKQKKDFMYSVLIRYYKVTWVKLTENAQSDTFNAPCCCFENAPNTALTIVCTTNVSIDCKKNEGSSLLVAKYTVL